MPEYSTPKLTPDETTKLPGMNGSSSGYVLTSELLDIIRSTYGQANGVASLDSSGKLPTAQLPDIADDVLVYASKALLPAQGVEAKIYITTDDNILYRWDATLGDYVQLSVDLSDYATLDDLAAEESAREAADTNLNDALTALDHRVENLEQAKGDYVVNTYKDGSITPSGKGAWAIVEGLRGVSRVENQVVKNSAFADLSNWAAVSPDSASVSDGVATVNHVGTGTTQFFQMVPSAESSHVYLVSGWFKASAGCTARMRFGGVETSPSATLTANVWTQICGLVTNRSGNTEFNFYSANLPTNNTLQAREPILVDLTIYFGGSIPSDADTIAEIQQNYPHLLTPSEYGVRIVDASYTGVRAWARNIFNQETEQGIIYSTGSLSSSTETGRRSADYLPCRPNVTYYGYFGSTGNLFICWYDSDKNFISRVNIQGQTAQAPSNAYWYKISTDNTYGATYKGDVCINVSDSQNGTYTPYHAPSTLSLTFTGKSAGAVADTLETNAEIVQEIDGEKVKIYKKRETERIATVVYDGSSDENWQIYGSVQRFFIEKADIKINSGSTVPNLTCDKLKVVRKDLVDGYDKAVGVEYKSFVLRIDSTITTVEQLRTWLTQNPVTINYELNTPVVTLSDPLIDNTLLTEAGGRMATVQTGTVVDGSFDMGFITL